MLLFPLPTFAQSTPLSSPLTPVPSYVPPTSPIYTDLLVHNLVHTFSCIATGSSIIGQPCLTYQITKDAQGAIQSIPILSSANLQGGLLGSTTGLIAGLYANPPIRAADYLASVGQDFGFAKEAHAQVTGSGQGVLSPIFKLWEASRNVSYVIMILIFVIIGLMIMFRQKINPQTVITAQAALPGLVIGLIMITFSYFLAGLISDMAYVGTNVVGYYFALAQDKTNDANVTDLVTKLSSTNVINLLGPFSGIMGSEKISGTLDAVMSQLPDSTQGVLRIVSTFLGVQLVAPLAGGIPPPYGLIAGPIISLVAGTAAAAAPTFFIGFFLGLAATLALLYAMVKLLLRLLTSFLVIIFLTITAPFQFLIAALPGRQNIATDWILNMLGNILVFPAVLAVIYFIALILGPANIGNDYPLTISSLNQIQNTNVVPVVSAAGVEVPIKIINERSFPMFGGLDFTFINILIAFATILALPKIPDIVVAAVGKAGQAGQMLGQELSGSIRSGQGYAGQAQGAFSQSATGFGRTGTEFFDTPGYLTDPTTGQIKKVTAGTKKLGYAEIYQSGYRPGGFRTLRGR